MFSKISTLVASLAIIQLVQVAQGFPAIQERATCAISLTSEGTTCVFKQKNQKECAMTEELMKKQFGCSDRAGNGCSILYKSCSNAESLATTFDAFCAEMKGDKSTTAKIENSPGLCTPNQFTIPTDGMGKILLTEL